jgi:hypothetical protein
MEGVDLWRLSISTMLNTAELQSGYRCTPEEREANVSNLLQAFRETVDDFAIEVLEGSEKTQYQALISSNATWSQRQAFLATIDPMFTARSFEVWKEQAQPKLVAFLKS